MVEDRTVEFELCRDPTRPPPALGTLSAAPFTRAHWRDAFDECQLAERQSLWTAKSALDDIDESKYRSARDALFPLAVSGSQGVQAFGNRAGHKLREVMEATGVWERLRDTEKGTIAFADVCGGPGAFSQALFVMCRKHRLQLRGFGMTLRNVEGLDWYPGLLSKKFIPTYGIDGTGDIFNIANIEALHSIAFSENMKLVVADGGFHVPSEIANYQETISGRILFAQWFCALKLLRVGGCFVLKLFDTFSPLLRAMLFLSTHLYEHVHIVKPRHSRVVNSERYLVCLNYQGTSEEWMAHFERCYTDGFLDNDSIPTIIPVEWIMEDKTFCGDLEEMNRVIATSQVTALQMVLEHIKSTQASG